MAAMIEGAGDAADIDVECTLRLRWRSWAFSHTASWVGMAFNGSVVGVG